MDFNNLTPEQMSKARNAKSPEELMALAKEEGIELSDEQLDAVAGGEDWVCSDCNYTNTCPADRIR